MARAGQISGVTNFTQNEPKCFYIYALLDPRDGSVFYVGCTKDPARRGLSPKAYTPPTSARIEEIQRCGLRSVRRVIATCRTRERAARQEIRAIKWLRKRGHALLNAQNAGSYQRTPAELEAEWGNTVPPDQQIRPWSKQLRARYPGLGPTPKKFKDRQVWIRKHLS